MKLRLPASPEIVRLVAHLDHVRDTWRSEGLLPEHRLEEIEEESRLRSVAASCRMAGLHLSEAEIDWVLSGGAGAVREAPEIRGYARAFRTPFPASGSVVTPEEIGRLHAIVRGSSEDRPPQSPYRRIPLHHEAFEHGRATGRVFQTLPPRMIPDKLQRITGWLELELRGSSHPLLVIGTFALAFRVASPFENANGRMTRVMTWHLLRRAGWAHMPYASLDSILEELRDRYHDALGASETRLWTGGGNLEPWLVFFLDLLRVHADRAAGRLGLERGVIEFSHLQRSILDAVREHGIAGAALLMSATGANRNTLKDNLRRLVDRGMLERMGTRRGTRYRLADSDTTLH